MALTLTHSRDEGPRAHKSTNAQASPLASKATGQANENSLARLHALLEHPTLSPMASLEPPRGRMAQRRPGPRSGL